MQSPDFHGVPIVESYVQILPPKKYVGEWQIGGPGALAVRLEQRPNFITRIACKHVFLFVWVDYPEPRN